MTGRHRAPRAGAAGRAARRGGGLALALLLGLACAAPPGGDASVAERRAWAEAVGLLAQDRDAGAQALQRFAETHPQSPLVADARLRLAELALEEERVEVARDELQQVLRNHPQAPGSDAARLLLARIERARGEPEAAWRVLRDVRLPLLPGASRREAQRLLADLAGEVEDPAERLRWLARIRAGPQDDGAAAELDREIDTLLARLDLDTLAQVAQRLGREPPAARVRMEEAERRLRRRDLEGARSALEAAAALPLGPGDEARLRELEAAAERGLPPSVLEVTPTAGEPPAVDPAAADGVIGVALPLSGPWASFGEEALQGVLLAADLLGAPDAGRSGVVVRVRDTGGDPEGAARAVAELARDPEVSAVIGPLLADGTRAAAEVAERSGLPLLVLTRSEEAGQGLRFVLHVGSSPRTEAELLAAYATRTLGIRRFAILYPDDDYGLRLRAAFWDAAEAQGGRIAAVAAYPPDATDFAGPIRRLVGYELLSSGERAALAERERLRTRAKRMPPERAAELREEARELTGPDGAPLPPFVDFGAVFIPDAHENAALLAPHLAFHGVRGVRLLGLSGFHHPKLVEIGGEHVEGAVFTADFDPEAASPAVQRFTRRFRARFGDEPGFLAAQAYDAAQILVRQIQDGRGGRRDLMDGLADVRFWPGVAGVLAFGLDGQVTRRPLLLGVERGEIVSVDERDEPPRLPRPARGELDGEEAAAPAELPGD